MPLFQRLRLAALLSVTALAAFSAGPARAQSDVAWEAYAGEPLGVGRLSLEIDDRAIGDVLGAGSFRVEDPQHRVFYPAYSRAPVRLSLRNLIQPRRKVNVYFLFRGDEPLEVTFRGESYALRPGSSSRAHQQLLEQWWEAYRGQSAGLVERLVRNPAEASVVDTYLRAMLSQRLDLTLPLSDASWQDMLTDDAGLMLDTSEVRQAILGARMLGKTAVSEPVNQALPQPPPSPPLEVPKVDDVEIEPIAMHVPQEAFYLRFGSFSNYLWFRDTLQRGGGDLASLITLKAVSANLGERMERQLGIKETALSRMVGDTVIADVALVGTDLYLADGASIGILFQARSSPVLAADITVQRAQAMAATPGAKEELLTTAGKRVSYISSPDNAMRSFYASDGDFHLVTTSRTLVERFLAVGPGEEALGTSAAFRHARTLLPLSRGDTVTAFFSDAFFQNLFGPRYWVELGRRVQADADLQATLLALLAAHNEGQPHATVEELRQGGFLPEDFGPRADGSRALLVDGRPVDSVRGGRGTLTPIPDVPIEQITASEADSYAQFRQRLADSPLKRVGPVMAGIAREAVDGGKREKIRIDFAVSPVAPDLARFLAENLGEPTTDTLGPLADDIAWGQIVLQDQTVFGGLRDFDPPLLLLGDALVPLGLPQNYLYGYLGTDGPGLEQLDWLQLSFNDQADAQGYTRGLLGLWKRDFGPFCLYSFHRETLEEVAPQIRGTQTERAAQIRLRVDDLGATRAASLLNRLGYNRGREAVRENLRLIHTVSQQLGVPMPDARQVAEGVLNARLVSPLGGDYMLQGEDRRARWTAAALETESGFLRPMPHDYQTPPLNWLRGLELDAAFADGQLSGHAELLADWPEEK